MKPRALVIAVCLVACGLSILGVVLHARQLDALRTEGLRLQRHLKELRDEPSKRPNPPANAEPLLSAPSSELLRLRSQVSQLTRRQRELAKAQPENERLRARIAVASTNTGTALPPGYLRKSEARYLGYASPEATLQTLLWAIQNRDYTNLVASFTPEIARDMEREMKQTGKSVEQFFKEVEALPGFYVLDRVATGDDEVELKVEIAPGIRDEAQSMRFRLLNGEWKLDSH